MSYTSTGHWTAEECLQHHGIKGQRWGVRRFQNPDGTLTSAGRERYNVMKEAGKIVGDEIKKYKRDIEKSAKEASDFKKKYIDSGDEGTKNWLNDTFGRGQWQEMFDSETDGIQAAKEAVIDEWVDMDRSAKNVATLSEVYIKTLEPYYKKFTETPVSQLSRKDYKVAKETIKRRKKGQI